MTKFLCLFYRYELFENEYASKKQPFFSKASKTVPFIIWNSKVIRAVGKERFETYQMKSWFKRLT